MRVPNAVLTIDGTELTGPQAGLSTAWIDIGMGGAHDRARLALGWQSPVADVEPGAEVSVAIGYDDPELVLTGLVDTVGHRPWGLVVDVLAAPVKLSTTWVGRSFIDLSAGDIVRDLASEAGVDEGEIGDGPTVAAHHVDERRSAWQHVQRLAATTGAEVSTAADGGLNFTPAPGADAGGLGGAAGAAASAVSAVLGGGPGNRYGAELHDFTFGPVAEVGPRSAVAAHGAGSELGSDKWHILVGEPAGGAPDGPTLVPALVRDREGADALAGAIAASVDRSATRGWLRITGNAALRARDVIEVSDLPHRDTVSLRARRLTHRFGRESGFVTTVEVEGAAA